jgi:hypothetical protein
VGRGPTLPALDRLGEFGEDLDVPEHRLEHLREHDEHRIERHRQRRSDVSRRVRRDLDVEEARLDHLDR